MRCPIHVSVVEAVSSMISESVGNKFLVLISEAIGVACAVESIRHPLKHFC